MDINKPEFGTSEYFDSIGAEVGSSGSGGAQFGSPEYFKSIGATVGDNSTATATATESKLLLTRTTEKIL
jgi:hypothetical protein